MSIYTGLEATIKLLRERVSKQAENVYYLNGRIVELIEVNDDLDMRFHNQSDTIKSQRKECRTLSVGWAKTRLLLEASEKEVKDLIAANDGLEDEISSYKLQVEQLTGVCARGEHNRALLAQIEKRAGKRL